MNSINFDPNIDQIIPVGFYSHPQMHRCNLIYPMKNNYGWFFPENYWTLKFQRIFYVFSPSILPLPPEVRMYYTIVKSVEPYNIIKIQEMTDPFDLKALLNLDSIISPKHKHKIGIYFGAYRKPVANTVPMYSYVRNTLGRSLYLSPERNLPGEWISKFHFKDRIISPIFFLNKLPKFKIENKMCYPSKSGMDISQCVKNLSTTTNNIKKLHDSEFNILQPTLKNPNGSHKNNTYLILLIITISIGILSIGIVFRYKNL